MAGRSKPMLWLSACAGSAVLLVVVVLFMAGHAPRPPVTNEAPPATTAPIRCTAAEPVLRRAEPDAEAPPVILWAAGEVRLFLDGKPEFSPPESPKHFAPGVHVLRVEAAGAEPFETKLRLMPFQPALIHAQADHQLGVTLLRLGVICASCDAPVAPLTGFTGERSRTPTRALFTQAAAWLRKDQWAHASVLLGSVAPRERNSALYHRLASATWLAAASPTHAREEAELLANGDPELRALLKSYDALTSSEEEHYAAVVMSRWNRVTEQHAAILGAASQVKGLDTATSEQRMERLSAEFREAANRHSVPEEERVFLEAEETVKSLLSRVMAARPDDCELRTRIATALAGEAP